MVIQNGHPPDQALTCHDPGTPKNAHPDCWVNPWPRVFPASTTGVHLPQSRAQSKDNSECVRKQLVSWKPWSLHCAWFWHVLRASKKMNRPQMFHFFSWNHNNYFASSDPHHDISKQLVDTTFVWSFCHGTFAQLTIPIICFTWQVIVHVSLSNRI